MPATLGQWTQRTPFTDGQIFVPAGGQGFVGIAGSPVLTLGAVGKLYYAQTTAATTYIAVLSEILRTGQLATPALNQEQFGTAASQPGPSSVPNTSDPLALPPGFPPLTSSQLPTKVGSYNGAIPKGLQVNWVDLIYSGVGTLTPAVGLTATVFANNVAPAVTNIIALGLNGLPTAAQANPYRTRVSVSAPAFSVADGTELILEFTLTAGTSANFYGAVVGVSYNYN